MMHQEHSHHEENILYPFLNGYLPGYTRFVTKVTNMHTFTSWMTLSEIRNMTTDGTNL